MGEFSQFDKPTQHWFDGAGYVINVDFIKGKAFAQWKLIDVQSPVELNSQGPLLGRFGLAPKGLWRRISSTWNYDAYLNSANTALLHWQNRLFALYEGSIPTEIDFNSLDTLGPTDLEVVKRAFSAHPKYHMPTRSYYNFGFRVLPKPCLDIYKLPDEGSPSLLYSIPYNGCTFMHDFAVSKNFITFFCSPVFAHPWAMLVQGKPLSECMKFQTQKFSEVIVIPIQDPENHFKIKTSPMLFTHTANSYDDDEKITIDGVMYKDGSNLDWINTAFLGEHQSPTSPGQLHRLEISIDDKSLSSKQLFEEAIEVPQMNLHYLGQLNHFYYAAGYDKIAEKHEGFYNCIYQLEPHSGQSKQILGDSKQIFSEPVFLPRSTQRSEQDGYLAVVHHHLEANTTFLSLLDTYEDSSKVICRLSFEQPMPFTFHGLWKALSPSG